MRIRIGDTEVGPDRPPYIIAEMSGNHDGSLEKALAIVDAAASAGAHAVKLQTYTADTMTLDIDRDEFVISNPDSLWYGRTLYDLYQEAHTPWEWHPPIMDRAREHGLACFSSPFDAGAVDFLEGLGVPCYKIASLEITDIPLIEKVASTGKPVIMSTGIATTEEIIDAVDAARTAGCEQLVLLKCTSSYPASPDDTHLRSIPGLQERFQCQVGLSDHTLGIGVAVAAVALGASVIEKHITLDRNDGGVDAAFSLEPDEFRSLVVEADRARRGLGSAEYHQTASAATRSRRRSLYVTENIAAGAVLSPENIRSIRPGLGLQPKHYRAVLGRRVAVDVERGTPLAWDLLVDDEAGQSGVGISSSSDE
jgi:pseudaminic acid synthase